jgi:RimJ/RimL family protein N-acetyltransferase
VSDPILLDLPERIETARLILRPPRAGDGPALHRALVESLPELRRFLASLPWVAADQTVDSAEAFCRKACANFISRRDLVYALVDKDSLEPLGSVGLHRTVWATPKTEVGYWLRSSRTGRGLMSEAVGALVDVAFSELRMARVEIITDEENMASRRVAERCQFQLEGLHRHERRAPDGSLRNTCVYARLAPSSASGSSRP